jgi:hypothetical protein
MALNAWCPGRFDSWVDRNGLLAFAAHVVTIVGAPSRLPKADVIAVLALADLVGFATHFLILSVVPVVGELSQDLVISWLSAAIRARDFHFLAFWCRFIHL